MPAFPALWVFVSGHVFQSTNHWLGFPRIGTHLLFDIVVVVQSRFERLWYFFVSADLKLDSSLNGSVSEQLSSAAVPRRRSSVGSTCSDWFNTTRDEMILYERFGEDYDEVCIQKLN